MHNFGVSAVPGKSTFHDRVAEVLGRDPMAYEDADGARAILTGLREAYQRFNDDWEAVADFDYMRVWTAAEQWLKDRGIQ
jgi:hypothetical protein